MYTKWKKRRIKYHITKHLANTIFQSILKNILYRKQCEFSIGKNLYFDEFVISQDYPTR